MAPPTTTIAKPSKCVCKNRVCCGFFLIGTNVLSIQEINDEVIEMFRRRKLHKIALEHARRTGSFFFFFFFFSFVLFLR
jgi:hypothetical protein